jgi:cytochrome b561
MTARYRLSQRIVHWLVALMVACLLATGMTLGWLGYDGAVQALGEETTGNLYKYHKTFGVLLLGLMTLRIGLRLGFGSPPYDPPLPAFYRAASLGVHGLLYLALMTMPILGWLGTAAGGYPVQFFELTLPGLIAKDPDLGETLFWLHGLVGWLILGLALVHIGAALMHWLIRRDGVMGRMSLSGSRDSA